MPEAVKPQVAAPNFVLTLLAACSTSVPISGEEGLTKISDQLSGLLQGKAMAMDELNLLYRYKFGFSIADALKFADFTGTFQDFVDLAKCFSVDDVSIWPRAKDEQPVAEEGALAATSQDHTQSKDDEISDAETESTLDALSGDSEDDSDVDVAGWYSCGNRLVRVVGSPALSDTETDDVSEASWRVLGSRIAATLQDADEDVEGPDAEAWQDVGSRLVAACKKSKDSENPSPDAAEWHSVGTRILGRLDSFEDDAEGY